MKKILTFTALFSILLLTAAACGGSHKNETPENAVEVEQQNTQLAQALSDGDLGTASAMADSMSLFVDDFTPDQTVQVLMAFLNVHNDAVAKKETRRDLETLRKFVDVYDIALSVNPNDTRAAFNRAREVNPEINFDSIARMFREKLAQYDAVHDGSLNTSGPEPADTVAQDTTDSADDVPLELRPAE